MGGSLWSVENLLSAWDAFKQGKQGKPDVLFFEYHLEDHLFALSEELSTKTYRHQPYHRFTIQDPKMRVIHKATVRDRVVHHLVFRFLEPYFVPSFIHQSYSSQIGKGTHRAVDDVAVALRKVSQNYTVQVWVLKMDVAKFFDSIDHDILLGLLQRRVDDPDIIWVLERIIRAYHSPFGRGKGVPIGNLTSQIFANIYLGELDQYVKHVLRMRWYFRYADDAVVIGHSPALLAQVRDAIGEFLQNHLQLRLHPRKVFIRKFHQGIDFLGVVLRPHYRVLRPHTARRMLTHAARCVEDYNHGRMDACHLRQTLASYRGLLQHTSSARLADRLAATVWWRLDNPNG